jgi:TetR/AcrR family transcriptional regulator, cholesterol catabolism regulator
MSSIGRRRSNARREATPGYSERRQRLLRAAAEVFKEKGFQAASINDIAELFGGDRASIYYYYASKHEIFIDLIRQAVEEVVLLAEGIATSGQRATVRLRDVFVKTLDAYERHYPYMYVYIQEDMRKVPGDGTSAGKELQDLGDRYERAVQQIIDEGVESGEFRASLDSQMMKFAIIGALNWSHRWHVPGGRLSGAEIGAAFTDLFLNGALAGPAGAGESAADGG